MRVPLKLLAVAAFGAALAGAVPVAAEAGQDPAVRQVHDGRYYGPPRYYYGPPPRRYYGPPPRAYYVPPPRVYYPPPRIYYPPPPRYYAPPPPPGVGLYFRF
jgi:hypothetical protein